MQNHGKNAVFCCFLIVKICFIAVKIVRIYYKYEKNSYNFTQIIRFYHYAPKNSRVLAACKRSVFDDKVGFFTRHFLRDQGKFLSASV